MEELIETKFRLAYLAGALDGDGSFSLIKGYSSVGVSPLYYPMIQLANAHKLLVDLLLSEFGGSVGVRAPYEGKDGSWRLPSYYWKLEKSTRCLPALAKIIPYLVVKQERASFLRDYIFQNPFIRGSKRLSEDVLARREEAHLKMKAFNDIANTYSTPLSDAMRCDSSDGLFWSYVAGLMDTDGSFSLKKEIRKSGGSKSPVYTPTILLTMTDCRGVNYIMNNFVGGNMCTVKAKTASKGFCYRFSITSRKNVARFIEQCLPFLRVKKKIASEILYFCRSVKTMHGSSGVSVDQAIFREKCYSVLRELNNSAYR
jgi:hypothetical protein